MTKKKSLQPPTIEQIDMNSARLTLDQMVCIVMGIDFSPAEAALRLGWTVERVEAELLKPECAFTIKMYREMLLTDLVKSKVRALRKKMVGKATIEERLIELAYLDPSETKGSIEGQVKACKTLGDLFGHAKDGGKLEEKSTDELEEFVRQGHKLLEGKTQTGPVQ